MTKGSGMIHPNMATTLGFVMTGRGAPAVRAGRHAGRRGQAQLQPHQRGRRYVHQRHDAGARERSVRHSAQSEGKQESRRGADAGDGGPGAADRARRRGRAQAGDHRGERAQPTKMPPTRIARSIANSPLVKTAIAGSDPNWGRILSAAGNAGVPLDPSKVDIDLQGVPVCRGGLAADFSESGTEEETGRNRMPDSIRHPRPGQGQRALLDVRPHGEVH